MADEAAVGGVRIVCCFLGDGPRPETKAALDEHAPDVVDYHDLTGSDDFMYGTVLTAYWRHGEDFAVVEPDIVVRYDVIDAFLFDEAGYLCFPYPWLTDVGPALGCTRFSADFLARYPTAMDEATATGVGWRQLDVVLMRHILARKYGEQPAVLLPPVEHLNEAKQLLPDASPEPLMSVPHW